MGVSMCKIHEGENKVLTLPQSRVLLKGSAIHFGDVAIHHTRDRDSDEYGGHAFTMVDQVLEVHDEARVQTPDGPRRKLTCALRWATTDQGWRSDELTFIWALDFEQSGSGPKQPVELIRTSNRGPKNSGSKPTRDKFDWFELLVLPHITMVTGVQLTVRGGYVYGG